MTTWEPLENRRMMSATVVTAATITADQQAITDARAALTVALSTDAQQLAADEATMHTNMVDAQLSLQTDTSVFAQTFNDNQAAFALKLSADHQVLAADAQLLKTASPAAAKAQYKSDQQQLKDDVSANASTVKTLRAQSKATLASDRAAIAAAKSSGAAAIRADTAAARRQKLADNHAIAVAEAVLRADQHVLAVSSR